MRPGSGRPPKPPGEKQSEKLMVTLTPSERRKLEAAAGDEPLGTYLRRLVLRSLARTKRG
jgi:hypothetical protein